jgi:hypothetical protein
MYLTGQYSDTTSEVYHLAIECTRPLHLADLRHG